jgi:hypothetical protein
MSYLRTTKASKQRKHIPTTTPIIDRVETLMDSVPSSVRTLFASISVDGTCDITVPLLGLNTELEREGSKVGGRLLRIDGDEVF